MATARIEIPEKLIPVFSGPADIRGAYGGRGSGKTRTFAKMAAIMGYMHGMNGAKGIILCARQFMNSLEDSSLEEVKRAIEEEQFLLDYYDVGDKYIKSRDGSISFSFAGLNRNIASVKSKGRILLCWVDEAEPVTNNAFITLIPTLREEGDDWNAELWVTWNPKSKHAAVERFRRSEDPLIKIVQLNWRDNKKFPKKLERERLRDLKEIPEQYEHIWEGDYITALPGAYYAKLINDVRKSGRITKINYDPEFPVHTAWDLGYSDDTAIWWYQVIAGEIRFLDFHSSSGNDPEFYINLIFSKPYKYGDHNLPHDARAKTLASGGKSIQEQFAAAFQWKHIFIVPMLSVQDGIQAARTMLPRCWFDEKCEDGIEALAQYQREFDDDKKVFKEQPRHDWTSHPADAFRMAAVAWNHEPVKKESIPPKYELDLTISELIKRNAERKRREL